MQRIYWVAIQPLVEKPLWLSNSHSISFFLLLFFRRNRTAIRIFWNYNIWWHVSLCGCWSSNYWGFSLLCKVSVACCCLLCYRLFPLSVRDRSLGPSAAKYSCLWPWNESFLRHVLLLRDKICWFLVYLNNAGVKIELHLLDAILFRTTLRVPLHQCIR
jgi:hypothetical protein